MQDINDKINNMHMGKLIHMLSHEMKRNQPIDKVIKADLTIMQKHILKFILLETMHKDLYQKDIEEEFQIRKSTVTGYVQLMEKNGYLTRESVKGDAGKKAAPLSRIGSVAVNCCPFTLGHRYLLEEALRQCDYLHLFLLSDNRGIFSARERYEMLQRGTEDLDRLILHETSGYMISAATFPTYFFKDRAQGESANCIWSCSEPALRPVSGLRSGL